MTKVYIKFKDSKYELEPLTKKSRLSLIVTSSTISTVRAAEIALASVTGVDKMRAGFQQLVDIFTVIAEPILYGYGVAALVLMATSSKERGWQRLKMVGYAYLGITCLPAFFSLLRYVGGMFKEALTM